MARRRAGDAELLRLRNRQHVTTQPLSSAVARQHEAIREEYRRQAPRWGRMDISDHLQWVVDRLPLSRHTEVIDVAAGTGLFSRAVAPSVARVTAVDLTPEMIEHGRQRAQQDGIANMVWQQGTAEDLPFPDATFDVAITRFSIHHFVEPATVLREMGRVCRAGGGVVAVDMVSDENHTIAARQDELETVMDPTHTSVLSPSRLIAAAAAAGLNVQEFLTRDVPMNFDLWQSHIPADASSRRTVRQAVEREIAGGDPTGMRPFVRDGILCFTHVWGVLIAGKHHHGRH
jgi:ubiquinone/menaquinone biosynthesis C-methylase UbiE